MASGPEAGGSTVDPLTLGTAAIALTVAAGSAIAPKRFLRAFGFREQDTTGAAVLGWRLFAIRTATLGVLSAGGNTTARDLFLPVQIMDQAAWWWGYRRGELPFRTAAMAAAASGAIIGIDLVRRSAAN